MRKEKDDEIHRLGELLGTFDSSITTSSGNCGVSIPLIVGVNIYFNRNTPN